MEETGATWLICHGDIVPGASKMAIVSVRKKTFVTYKAKISIRPKQTELIHEKESERDIYKRNKKWKGTKTKKHVRQFKLTKFRLDKGFRLFHNFIRKPLCSEFVSE